MKKTKLKNVTTRLKVIIITSMYMFPLMTIKICAEPSLNTGEAKSTIESWTKPIGDIGIWAVPGVTSAVLAVSGIMWLQKDEEEREQKAWKKTAVKIIKVAIVIELIPTICKILNL